MSPADRAAGELLYAERCARCHGARGNGDGPQAAATHPRPQRLSDRVWQANASNARLRRVLIGGGGAVNKSPLMPGNPDLAQKPAAVDALIAVIRAFAEP
ncbi:MAG TPA: cytochrome c [Pseudomonadota bacterium]|nr:cytochrome c [Pseudomonadota bacterium]